MSDTAITTTTTIKAVIKPTTSGSKTEQAKSEKKKSGESKSGTTTSHGPSGNAGKGGSKSKKNKSKKSGGQALPKLDLSAPVFVPKPPGTVVTSAAQVHPAQVAVSVPDASVAANQAFNIDAPVFKPKRPSAATAPTTNT